MVLTISENLIKISRKMTDPSRHGCTDLWCVIIEIMESSRVSHVGGAKFLFLPPKVAITKI